MKGLLGSCRLSASSPPPVFFFSLRKKCLCLCVFKEALVLPAEVPTCFPVPKERSFAGIVKFLRGCGGSELPLKG